MLFKDWEFYNITKTNIRKFPSSNESVGRESREIDIYIYLFGLPMALGVERLTTSKSGVGFNATAY